MYITNIVKQFHEEGMSHEEYLATLNENYEHVVAEILGISAGSVTQRELSKYELFRLFDENDKTIISDGLPKVALRTDCHDREVSNIEEYHRGVLWIVTNSKGDILLSQRAKDKDLFPEYWEIGGGHCSLDSYEGALEDELKDELGIERENYQIQSLFKIQFEDEYEKQTAKVYQVTVEDDFIADGNDGEVIQSKFYSPDEIRELIKTANIKLLPDNVVVLSEFLGLEQELEENIRFL